MDKIQHTDVETTAGFYESDIISGWENLYKEKRRRLYLLLSKHYIGTQALELGIADGVSTRYILDYFKTVTVVDASSHFIEEIKKNNPEVKAVHSYFEDYKTENKFSTIFMTHILEHLDNPLDVLNMAYNEWLTDNGNVLVSVPNANSIHRLVGVKMGMLQTPEALNKQDLLLGHRRVYTKETMLELISRTKFKCTNFYGLMFKPLSNRQIEKSWDAELIDAFFELGFDFPEFCSEIIFVLTK